MFEVPSAIESHFSWFSLMEFALGVCFRLVMISACGLRG